MTPEQEADIRDGAFEEAAARCEFMAKQFEEAVASNPGMSDEQKDRLYARFGSLIAAARAIRALKSKGQKP